MNLARARFAMQVFFHLLGSACGIIGAPDKKGSGLALLLPIIALTLHDQKGTQKGCLSVRGPFSESASKAFWAALQAAFLSALGLKRDTDDTEQSALL